LLRFSQYYISRSGDTKGMLYFQPPEGTWPPPAGSGPTLGAHVSSASHLIVLQNSTSYVRFEGISWQHARSTLIMSVKGAVVSHVTIDSCTVANGGGMGARGENPSDRF
jgi:hypothetical protein